MASSPSSHATSKVGDPVSEACWERIRRLDGKLLRGESFSGHEKNCAYLNTGGANWASVSHISGFDFPDDTRAVALTDWDGDGDVDVWQANRTAPQVRYLRNDTPSDGDWLEIQLRATMASARA